MFFIQPIKIIGLILINYRVCVGIQCPPDCAVWYCPTCLLKRAERGVTAPVEKAKRGRPLKKKSIS